METKQVIAALAALAQESRLAVFRLLVQAGPEGMPASRISEQIGVSPSSLSFHLKELTRADLATSRQEGRFIIYSVNYDVMNQVLQFLTNNCCGGNPCTSLNTMQCADKRESSVVKPKIKESVK